MFCMKRECEREREKAFCRWAANTREFVMTNILPWAALASRDWDRVHSYPTKLVTFARAAEDSSCELY